MIRTSIAPSPQAYNIPSTKANQSFSFGVSRDKYERVYLKENPPRDRSVPGPGNYSIKTNFIEKRGAMYSIRPNTTYASMFIDPTKLFPGPGAYNASVATENHNGYTI